MAPTTAERAGELIRHGILQVTTSDRGGGASAVAASLNKAFADRGLLAWMAVGAKHSHDHTVIEIPNAATSPRWERGFDRIAGMLDPLLHRAPGAWHLQKLLRDIGNPARALARMKGSEYFDYPGTWQILSIPPSEPAVLHLHNLHGGYFDLRALPVLSKRVPTIVTLHDAWMLSGHCAHSFDCPRWVTGCGSCPYLSIPPAVARDDTAANWQRKLSIYARSDLYVVTPSQWLMDKVDRSMLGPAARGKRVIPNGVDLSVFNPGDPQAARARLGLPATGLILLFAANGIRANPWKDYATMRSAIELLADDPLTDDAIFIALGESGPAERIGSVTVRFEKFREDQHEVADFYRAADIYLHAARVDTFPNTVIESLACGTPVVATAVGGIPEQIRSPSASHGPMDGATGILVEPANPVEFAGAVRSLAADDALRARMGRNAAEDARIRFSLDEQAAAYLELYSEMLAANTTARDIRGNNEDNFA